jgi:hypothetical protein
MSAEQTVRAGADCRGVDDRGLAAQSDGCAPRAASGIALRARGADRNPARRPTAGARSTSLASTTTPAFAPSRAAPRAPRPPRRSGDREHGDGEEDDAADPRRRQRREGDGGDERRARRAAARGAAERAVDRHRVRADGEEDERQLHEAHLRERGSEAFEH